MGQTKHQWRRVWALARRQHGVVARRQLLALGHSSDAIHHRIQRGLLHRVHLGVYAVGRPELTQEGTWMAAVLSCGPQACLSHLSAAGLWELRRAESGRIDVSVPAEQTHRRPGIAVHRRANLSALGVACHRGIPVTSPACTLIDLAACLGPDELEAAIKEADKRDLTDPE